MCNLFDELTIRHGFLCRQYENLKTGQMIFQQVVPPALVQNILLSLHSDHKSSNLGVTKTLEKVRSRFYWPGHKRDVEVFVASCFVCQKRNSPTKKHIHSLRACKPSFPFSTVGIDFLGPLPHSVGNQYTLLIGDHFTKWHEAVALPDQSAPTTAKALVDHWITRFGCPESLHSDQGRNFEAKLFTSLTKLLQLDKTRTSAFDPQSNAVIERTNRTLLNMLAKTTDKNQRNWSELLPYVMLAYRTFVHESTGYTPYFLLFGHEATLPIDLQFPPPSDANWTNYHEYVAETRLRFHTTYEQDRQYLKGQQKRQHALYNAKVHGPKYTEGQMVFLHNPSTPQGLSPKLHSFWRGPYKITQVISEMTYIEIETNKELIVHYDCMKPCRSPPGGFVPPANTPSALMQPPNELASNSTPAKCHSCFCETPITCTSTVDPVPVSSSVPIIQPAPPTTFSSSPVANDNPPEPCAPPEEETFPNRSSDSTLPYSSHVPEIFNSPNRSFNTAVSSTSFLDDQFPEQHTVVPPSRSVLPINTSTPTKTVTQRPLLTDALLNHASSRMTTLSPIRRAENKCPRLLRSKTANQRHATAQHILNKQLAHELKNELRLETTQTAESSGQSIETTQSTSQTAVRSRPIRRKFHFRSFGKNKGPKTGRK